MKKITLFICLIALLVQVNAQPKENKTERVKHRSELIKKLNLTQEQQAQLKLTNESFRQKSKDLKANDNLTLGEYKQKIKALKEERENAFEAMLNANQKKQLADDKIQLKEERKAAAKARFNKLKTELQLTKEQETKLKEKHKELKQQIATIKNDNALTQQQKIDEIKNLHTSHKEYLKTILTQEQLQKLEQYKKVK